MDTPTTPPHCPPGEIDNTLLWPDGMRGVPNVIARSGLIRISLPIVCNTTRPLMHCSAPCPIGIKLIYKGEPLDESDIDVWLEIMHLTRNQWGFGSSYCLADISARELLRLLGRCDSSGKNGLLLWHSIRRLCECHISISTEKYSYHGSLLQGCFMDMKTRKYGITIDPDIRQLFGISQLTMLDVSHRRKLRRKPLALWLHRFYSSFNDKSIYQYSLDKIRTLALSTDPNLFGFRRNVKNALNELGPVTGWSCWIDKHDHIYVVK